MSTCNSATPEVTSICGSAALGMEETIASVRLPSSSNVFRSSPKARLDLSAKKAAKERAGQERVLRWPVCPHHNN